MIVASDIGSLFTPTDLALVAPVIGAPGLVLCGLTTTQQTRQAGETGWASEQKAARYCA